MLEKIRSGGQGVVYKAKNLCDGKIYACKQSEFDLDQNMDYLIGFLREVIIYSELNLECIPKFHSFKIIRKTSNKHSMEEFGGNVKDQKYIAMIFMEFIPYQPLD